MLRWLGRPADVQQVIARLARLYQERLKAAGALDFDDDAVVDPLDDMTVWTIQEYNQASNSYAVRVGRLVLKEPNGPEHSGQGLDVRPLFGAVKGIEQ